MLEQKFDDDPYVRLVGQSKKDTTEHFDVLSFM